MSSKMKHQVAGEKVSSQRRSEHLGEVVSCQANERAFRRWTELSREGVEQQSSVSSQDKE